MISVDALKDTAPPKAEPIPALDEVGEAQVDYLDRELERAAAALVGDMFDAVLTLESATTLPVVNALKKRWEAGGWTVGVFRRSEVHVQIIFVKPRRAPSSPVVSALAARVSGRTEDLVIDDYMRRTGPAPRTTGGLLVRMPTRARAEQALSVLSKYRALATGRFQLEVVIDDDDATMHCAQVLGRLRDLGCVVTSGPHCSKIEAVNGGRVDDWSILVLASDDMVPVVEGWDRRIVALMEQHWPLGDGAITLNDGYNKEHVRQGKPVLCTLPILGRHLYEQFVWSGRQYIYHPQYRSLFCDDEYTELLTSMRRLTFVDELLIEHRHHAAGKAAFDALYQHNDALGGLDKATYERRAGNRASGSQFWFGAPPLTLSILVCSLESRRDKLAYLVELLRHQMRDWPREVEILVEVDAGEITVGEKRQRLLERAVGCYVAFIDDDDLVAHDYVARVLHALEGEPGVDCTSLVGEMTVSGENPERFEHSIKYAAWRTNPRGQAVRYERGPNHLSAVRRDLALQVGFVAKNVGEDHLYSQKLWPLLKTEANTGDSPLYYYLHEPAQSVQSKKVG